MSLITSVVVLIMVAQPLGANDHSDVLGGTQPRIEVVDGGMLMNGMMVNRNWSVNQLDRLLGCSGRWLIPTEQKRLEAFQKFGRPLTTDTYIYDDIGINVFVDHQSKAIKSLAIRFGGKSYSNSPAQAFSGAITVNGVVVNRDCTAKSLKVLHLKGTSLPFSKDLVVGPFKYSFIFDEALESSKLAEISVSLAR